MFFGSHERNNFEIHSLVTLGGIGVALPFIIKACRYGLSRDEIGGLCSSLEALVLRHRIIGTRADITSRVNDVFEKFTENDKDTSPIVSRIDWMKTTTDWWCAHWNNEKFREALQGGLNHSVAKFLLWKYENHLIGIGKGGSISRYDQIERPELEHIAPITEPESRPHGYDTYDEEFCNQFIDCLGNYLLLTRRHNRSIQNDPFLVKHEDYTWLAQQREVRKLVPHPDTGIWSRQIIQERKERIIAVIMAIC